MSDYYVPLDSLPPRKLLLYHRLILLVSGLQHQGGWGVLVMGSLFSIFFGIKSLGNPEIPFWFALPAIIPMVFVLLGAWLVVYTLYQNARSIHLLVNGKFAQGKLISQKPMYGGGKTRQTFKVIIQFQDEEQTYYETSLETRDVHLLESEEAKRILYLPKNPNRNVIFALIPSGPQLDLQGEIVSPPFSQLTRLIIPIVGVAVMYGILSGWLNFRF